MAPAASSIYFSEQLIVEVLSILPVKSLVRLKCVSTSWNSLISQPTFVKLHLNRYSQNVNFTLVHTTKFDYKNIKSVSFTDICMLDKPPSPTVITTRRPNHCHQLNDTDQCSVIGSSNGLICLAVRSLVSRYRESWFHIWNPATRTMSEKLATYGHNDFQSLPLNFTFGYDNAKDTFKLVRFVAGTTNVRVFSLRCDNVWRYIENSPVSHSSNREIEVVHFSCSVNCLAIHTYDYRDYYDNVINIEQFVIISLDLSTETHTKLLPPQGFNEVPFVVPNLSVLNGCFCFCHAYKKIHFVIWQMKEFRVEDSWTQFLKISYDILQPFGGRSKHDLDFRLLPMPLCLSENNDTLLFTKHRKSLVIPYNRRVNKRKGIYVTTRYTGLIYYVESLFSYC